MSDHGLEFVHFLLGRSHHLLDVLDHLLQVERLLPLPQLVAGVSRHQLADKGLVRALLLVSLQLDGALSRDVINRVLALCAFFPLKDSLNLKPQPRRMQIE